MRATSGGASAGRMAARRSTPGWHSQLLALATRRIGVAAPRVRANSPAAKSWLAAQGRARSPGASSLSWGRYRKEGSSGRASTAPGPLSWGMGSTCWRACSPSLAVTST